MDGCRPRLQLVGAAGQHEESERDVLKRLERDMARALASPALSIGWRVALHQAQAALRDDAEIASGSPRQTRRQAPGPG